VRGVAAGVAMLAFVLAFEGSPPDPGMWFLPLSVPILCLLVFLPMGYVGEILNRIGIPFTGLLQLPAKFLGVLGDPLLYILHQVVPPLVPVDELKIINWGYGIWVYASPSAQAASVDEISATEPTQCPFAGRVVVDKDTSVLGFNWPTKAIAFHIRPDWLVTEPNGREFGWIDVNGVIHRGLPLSGAAGVDPNATLAGEVTPIRVHGDSCWNSGEKFGALWRF